MSVGRPVEAQRLEALRAELERARRDTELARLELEATAKELAATNAELRATNAELGKANDELRTTNVELETMNGELRATNDELELVNAELQRRGLELSRPTDLDDARPAGARTALVVLDEELCVQAWNAGARTLWGLVPEALAGRRFLGLDTGLPADELGLLISEAVTWSGSGGPVSLETVDGHGRALRCVASPLGGARPGVLVIVEANEHL